MDNGPGPKNPPSLTGNGVSQGDILVGSDKNAIVYTDGNNQIKTKNDDFSYDETNHTLILQNQALAGIYFAIAPGSGFYGIGDITSIGNNTAILLNDVNQTIRILSGDIQLQGRLVTNVATNAYGSTINAGLNDYHLCFSGGTGATTVNTGDIGNVVGTAFIISDGDAISSTSNITVDSGPGNNIVFNGSVAQTAVLNTDGICCTFQKVKADLWMCIAQTL